MAYSRKDVEKTKQNTKKFVRYQEGAEKYSMDVYAEATEQKKQESFERLAAKLDIF